MPNLAKPHPTGGPPTAAQSRAMSFAEAVVNVIVGYALAVLAQILVFPLFAIRMPLSDSLVIGLIFTVVSIARSYVLRRVFERHRRHGFQREAPTMMR